MDGDATPLDRYLHIRRATERLCAPLVTEDYVVQAMPNASPTNWHLAHTSWFGLVLPGAIRCADGSTLAFYERPEWMRAWFPLVADHVTACGRALRAVLEAPRVPA